MATGFLSDLADVARKAGLNVVEEPGWRLRGHGRFAGTLTVVCHHTAGPAKGNMPSLRVVTAGRADLKGPLCNYGLGRDGTVYVVSAGYAWHAGAVRERHFGNAYAIGIEAEGTGTSSWPEVQMDAYARLCRALCDHYGIPINQVLGHKEVCAPVGRKSDPNFDMAAFRRRVTSVNHKGDELMSKEYDDLLEKFEALRQKVEGSKGVITMKNGGKANITQAVQAAVNKADA